MRQHSRVAPYKKLASDDPVGLSRASHIGRLLQGTESIHWAMRGSAAPGISAALVEEDSHADSFYRGQSSRG